MKSNNNLNSDKKVDVDFVDDVRTENEKNANEINNEEKGEDNFDNTDDILALLQDYSDDPSLDKNIQDKEKSHSIDIAQDGYAEIKDSDDDLLELLGMISSQEESNSINRDDSLNPSDNDDLSLSEMIDDNQFMDDDMDDILAINDLIEDDESFDYDDSSIRNQRNRPSDVGDIFSDVLSAVDSLEDIENENILNIIPDKTERLNVDSIKKEKEEKKSFWHTLFEKIAFKNKDKQEEKSSVVNKELIPEDINNIEKSINQKEKINEKKENQKKKVDEKKIKNNKNMKASKKTTNKSIVEDDFETESPVSEKKNKSKKEIKQDNKIARKKEKNATKKEKSAIKIESKKTSKSQKSKSALQIIDEIEADGTDLGKINKYAAAFVLTFFSILVAIVIIGSNVYSYSLGIQNATANFERQRYTQAYNEVCGLDIKDKDDEIYSKIMTVMFVNKQLNSYNNYYAMGQYPEALDSLLKGLTRYDKYIELATKLGIKSDLNYVRAQIIGELKSKFNLLESDAVLLNNSENQTQYSENVFHVVQENIN